MTLHYHLWEHRENQSSVVEIWLKSGGVHFCFLFIWVEQPLKPVVCELIMTVILQ